MADALFIAWRSLKEAWEDFLLLVALNVVWALTVALPFAPLFVLTNVDFLIVLALCLLFALPLPIISGGLCFVTNQISRGKVVGWGTFARGIRHYWAKSLLVALVNLIVLVLIAANIQFYGIILEGAWTNLALSAWLILGAYWLLVQVFWFPMILELESEKVFVALRNSLGMVIITPGFSITLAVILAAIVVLSMVLTVPALLIMSSLVLLIANHATRSRLAYAQRKPYRPGEVAEDD
jgi:hypothetical protein